LNDVVPVDTCPRDPGCHARHLAAILAPLLESESSIDEVVARLREMGLDWRRALSLPFVVESMARQAQRALSGRPRYPELSLTAKGRQRLHESVWVLMRQREGLDVTVAHYLATGRSPGRGDVWLGEQSEQVLGATG
jgi:hypothetical protein